MWQAVAQRQLGLITIRQLRDEGVTDAPLRTMLSRSELVRRCRGLYAVTGAPVTLDQSRLAAVLATPHAALSHGAAAGVWGASLLATARPSIIVSHRTSPIPKGADLHRSRTLRRTDVVSHGPFPRITRPARTLLDLARRSGLTNQELEDVGADLLLGWPEERARLRTALRSGGPGTARLAMLFGEYLDCGRRPPQPGIERRLLALVRSADLPPPIVHALVDTPMGRLELDLAWPEVLLAVEADSARWHSSPAHLRNDRSRDQALATVGWQCLRVTWEQVTAEAGTLLGTLGAVYRNRACLLGLLRPAHGLRGLAVEAGHGLVDTV
ncbi:MAG: hypothetical protein NVS3B21_21450 [Acidimicrobiales bacterium]